MSQRTVKIQHIKINEVTGKAEGFAHVANFVSDKDDIEAVLEDAFRYTQNIDGSWSQGELIKSIRAGELEDNSDYNPNITVVAPLPQYKGETYGLRSSMVGDLFVIEGRAYVVGNFGFELVAG